LRRKQKELKAILSAMESLKEVIEVRLEQIISIDGII